jgi:hypothetical protein
MTTTTDKELDRLVAKHVFGYIIKTGGGDYDGHHMEWEVYVVPDGKRLNTIPFSTDIAAAWSVVEQMEKRGYFWIGASVFDGSGYQMSFSLDRHETIGLDGLQPTFSLAVCHAALLALGVSL